MKEIVLLFLLLTWMRDWTCKGGREAKPRTPRVQDMSPLSHSKTQDSDCSGQRTASTVTGTVDKQTLSIVCKPLHPTPPLLANLDATADAAASPVNIEPPCPWTSCYSSGMKHRKCRNPKLQTERCIRYCRFGRPLLSRSFHPWLNHTSGQSEIYKHYGQNF